MPSDEIDLLSIELTLQYLPVPDEIEAGASVVWCPAAHLAAAPGPWVSLLGIDGRRVAPVHDRGSNSAAAHHIEKGFGQRFSKNYVLRALC